MTNGAKLRVGIVGLGRAGRIHLDAWWEASEHLALRELDRGLPRAQLRVQVAS